MEVAGSIPARLMVIMLVELDLKLTAMQDDGLIIMQLLVRSKTDSCAHSGESGSIPDVPN